MLELAPSFLRQVVHPPHRDFQAVSIALHLGQQGGAVHNCVDLFPVRLISFDPFETQSAGIASTRIDLVVGVLLQPMKLCL
jgi:hypothetical protein